MQNSYQNKITNILSKKPLIFKKFEGGKKFKAYFGERYTTKIDLPDVGG